MALGPPGEWQGCWGQAGGESQTPDDPRGQDVALWLPAASAAPGTAHAPHTSAKGTNKAGVLSLGGDLSYRCGLGGLLGPWIGNWKGPRVALGRTPTPADCQVADWLQR